MLLYLPNYQATIVWLSALALRLIGYATFVNLVWYKMGSIEAVILTSLILFTEGFLIYRGKDDVVMVEHVKKE